MARGADGGGAVAARAVFIYLDLLYSSCCLFRFWISFINFCLDLSGLNCGINPTNASVMSTNDFTLSGLFVEARSSEGSDGSSCNVNNVVRP